MATHKVRATNEPDKELTVDDAELADLRHLGLLLEKQPTEKKKEA